MKRLLTFLISLGMVLMCLPTGVSAVNLSVVTFVAEGGKIYTSSFGERESPYTYMVSEGKNIEMDVWAESDDPHLMFSGWALSEDGEPEFQSNDIYNFTPAGDITFYAIFTECYVVTLNGNGGYFQGEPDLTELTFKVPKGSAMEDNYNTPDYPGKTKAQIGWAYTPDGEVFHDPYLWDYVPDGDVTLYAIWEDAIQVTLEGNGGYFYGEPSITSITFAVPKGECVNNYYSNPANPDGKMALTGWSESPQGPADYNRYLGDCFPENDITLYAIWSKGINVTLDGNGGYFWDDTSRTSITVIIPEGENLNDYFSTPKYPNNEKAMVGWSTSKTGPAEYSKYLEDCYPQSDMTLYAVWEDSYILTLNGNGYGYFWSEGKKSETYKVAVPKNGSVNTNYFPETDSQLSFAGWSYSPTGSVDIAAYDLYSLSLDGPLTLYAVWREGVTVTLDANGKGAFYNGKKTYTINVPLGEAIHSATEPLPYDDHVALAGWSFTPDGDVDLTTRALYDYVPSASITLYAVWVKGITLTLDGNGNGQFHTAEGISTQRIIKLPESQRVHYYYEPDIIIDDNLSFAGWSYKPDGDVDIGKYDLSNMSFSQDTTLYAVWRESYTLTLYANGGHFGGGSTTQTVKVVKGQPCEVSMVPAIDDPNLTLGGWSFTQDGPVAIQGIWGFVPDRDMSLYAVWIPAYSITFKTNEGWFILHDMSTGPRKVSEITFKSSMYGIYPPEYGNDNPRRAIIGWSKTNGGKVDFTNEQIFGYNPSSDLTLYAVWGKAWIVTFDANGGFFYDYESGKEVNTSTLMAADNDPFYILDWPFPENNNMDENFSGFSLARDGAPINMETFRITSDVTVYALWNYMEEPSDVWRLAGKGRFQTSMKIAEAYMMEKEIDKLDAVILASGENFADALAGSYLSYKKQAPILITAADFGGPVYEEVNTFINANLKKGGTVYVLGGTKAVPETVLTGLEGYEIKRLSGRGRFETNIEILKEAGVKDEEILVATGFNFADSLSASAVNRPILLVDQELSLDQKAYLDTLETKQFYILGGTGAVKEEVEKQLNEYGKVVRLAGKGRHETSILIAETFCPDADRAVLAYSGNFPDGLCAGPLASVIKAPLILTTKSKTDYAAAKKFCSDRKITSGYVAGGTSLIENDAAKDIFGLEATQGINNW